MADKNTIRNWFKTGLKPTQAQFWATWDSFWHKDEKIPITAIEDIENILNEKADAEAFDNHVVDAGAHADLFNAKEDKNQKGVAGGYAPLDELNKLAVQYLNIVNDLVTGGSDSLLSAEQGKLLQNQIDNINVLLTSDNVNLDNVQEIVDAIETVQMSLSTILVNDLTTGGTTKALTAEMGKLLQNTKLTATIATDAETQITSTITEDNKVVSRAKLFNWWTSIKSQAQTIIGSWTFKECVNLGNGTTSDQTLLALPANTVLTLPI